MQERVEKREIPIAVILVGLLLIVFAIGLTAFLATVTVSGSATLPNGSQVNLNVRGFGFAVSSSKNETEIDVGGYLVKVDRDLNLSVNGEDVAVLDAEPQDYDLSVDGSGLKITSAKRVIARIK